MDLVSFFTNIPVWAIVKVFFIIALLIYLIFAAVVVRQAQLMIQVISGQLNWVIKIIAWLHFFFAVFVILLALAIL